MYAIEFKENGNWINLIITDNQEEAKNLFQEFVKNAPLTEWQLRYENTTNTHSR